MRVAEVLVCKYSELNDEAKQRARDWYLQGMEYPFHQENIDSIKAFCEHFGVTLKDWSIGGRGEHLTTDAENRHFRGFTMEDAKKLAEMGYLPKSGMWLDCTMIQSFFEDFKRTGGDALYSFKQALESALQAINRDIEYHYSDEAVEEMMEVNDYEFDEDGRRF
jgi:hypothetical protein